MSGKWGLNLMTEMKMGNLRGITLYRVKIGENGGLRGVFWVDLGGCWLLRSGLGAGVGGGARGVVLLFFGILRATAWDPIKPEINKFICIRTGSYYIQIWVLKPKLLLRKNFLTYKAGTALT